MFAATPPMFQVSVVTPLTVFTLVGAMLAEPPLYVKLAGRTSVITTLVVGMPEVFA